mmetsp:Transcript_12509/g.36216  ORF Transcript_12509/g.36216 Transcript_12509/m.36216 type:complete len:689 (-) Transcript_12509:527-2593(-)|eukprot:CAMPEP_0118968074 /NCGR_PEP_ID=MMETSP1173-20130426/5366_1 /TAXON_ID=1034831 /ORGANISM="Rhizochromulina marina cf, Strain CCMP1243" /LENGTH=688 /DNA_ID=CAMNT_0006917133 /DNA_START=49 /DNA_END=2115 /DNA_ORIENTATION=+
MAAEDTPRMPGSWLPPSVKKSALEGRKLERDWDVTSVEQDAEHAKVNGDIVRTRFPPEPNGFLHIGHAKSMNMNFSLAFEKLGVPPEKRETVFRFDDTNPEAESKEYIESIREDVEWMGWKPARTTYASDYFSELHSLATRLVKKGKCYVCFQTSEEIEACREVAKKQLSAIAQGHSPGDPEWPSGSQFSPHRDADIETNLRLFEDMRKGKFAEGECCLRMKMDQSGSNLNMFDQVAYRVKYHPHPHAGHGWCIYPTYDFTHCVQDSLEHVDFSICTLEFESRRESYYWLLDALDIFKPMVFEMSRLNIEYVVLSKRKLIKLVQTGRVRGWDDPRMPTIKGLRRRGLTASMLNKFCNSIGVTRNENLIEYTRLEEVIRQELHETARRAMAVLDPIKVRLTNHAEEGGERVIQVPDFPPLGAASPTHPVTFTSEIFIDGADFRFEDSSDYYGLAPGKWVSLKYSSVCMRCDEVISGPDGRAVELVASLAALPPTGKRPKGILQWVPSTGITFEARLYNHLFSVPEVTSNWENELNPESEVVLTKSMVDPSILNPDGSFPAKETHFQFERIANFVVDKDTTSGHLVMNRTVSLKVNKIIATKTGEDAAKDAKRKEWLAQQEKLKSLENIHPKDFFRLGPDAEKYSKFGEDGIPTHLADGTALTKSAMKKLKKDQGKHANRYEKAQKRAEA